MAAILDQITVGDHLVFSLDTDPRTGAGTPAIVGTIAMVDVGDSGTTGEAYLKVGALDTDWRYITLGDSSATSVETGDFRHLALYKLDANGDVLNDELNEAGGGTIEVVIAADATRATDMSYQFPVVPGAITTADVVLTESDQTINGNKTFNDNVIVQGNLDVNGSLTYLNTTNTQIQDERITLNKGGAASSAGDAGIEVEEAGTITAYIDISSDRLKWCMKAPANANEACLDFSLLTANQNFQFPDTSGTFIVQPSPITGTANQVTWWLDNQTITAENGVAPNALTWDDTNNYFGVQTAAPLSILHVGNFTTTGAVGANAILLGQMNSTANIGSGATIIGGIGGANSAEGTDSLVSGVNSSASGSQSVALGNGSVASADNTLAQGLNSAASGAQSVAMGNGTTATQAAAFAMGNGADATAANAQAFGLNTAASGAQSVAMGDGASASDVNAFAQGLNSSATAAQAFALGNGSTASGVNSLAQGLSSTASGAQAIAMGNSADASADNAVAMGLSTTASGLQSMALGSSSIASGLTALAWGTSSIADGNYSIAMGRKAQTGGFAGSISLSDSQDFTSTATSADSVKMRFTGGWDLVKGGGANDDDGVNFHIRQDEVATTDATLTTVQTIAIPTDTTVMIKSKIIGARTGGTGGSVGDSAGYERTAVFKNIGGTVTVHKRQSDYTYEDQSSWRVKHQVSGTNAIVEVRGAANNNVQWEVTSYYQTVAHS